MALEAEGRDCVSGLYQPQVDYPECALLLNDGLIYPIIACD